MTGRSESSDLWSRVRLTRRTLFGATASAIVAGGCAHRFAPLQRDFSASVAAIQARTGGRIGVYALDSESQLELEFNARQRFAMCSTFKLLLAAAVLNRVDSGMLALDGTVELRPQDMLSHAPVTSARLGEGRISVRDLCAAAVQLSDNPAANLLLALIEGPAGLTQFLRSIGDRITRLDRTELDLNTNLPGDPRDTTTPQAMARTVERLLLGEVLSMQSRMQLTAWLRESSTGAQRLRAGLPAHWRVGDKTGTGANGATNDVMIAWPPHRSAVIGAVYMSESPRPTSELERAHAEIGALIAATVLRQG